MAFVNSKSKGCSNLLNTQQFIITVTKVTVEGKIKEQSWNQEINFTKYEQLLKWKVSLKWCYWKFTTRRVEYIQVVKYCAEQHAFDFSGKSTNEIRYKWN